MYFTKHSNTNKVKDIWTNYRKNNLKKQLIEHDNAFLNSLLSYTVYTNRKWTLDFIKNSEASAPPIPLEEIGPLTQADADYFAEQKKIREQQFAATMDDSYSNMTIKKHLMQESMNFTAKKAYETYIGDYIRKNFDLVNLPIKNEQYISDTYGYSTDIKFANGNYEALDNLACAGVFRSKNPDGSFTLHVAFRGTDTVAKPFAEYVSKAYSDMSAYYDCFKPLEKAILEYAKNPKNNIAKLDISGHSLGGAMVQEFFRSEDVKNSGLNMKGYTYGSPGSLKKIWHIFGPALYHTIRHGKFKQLGAACLSLIKRDYAYNPNIVQYKHQGDLIPFAGWLGYKNSGHSIELKDVASVNREDTILFDGNTPVCSKEPEFKKFKLLTKAHEIFIKQPMNIIRRTMMLEYHDMLRYVQNVSHHTETLIFKHPELADYTPHVKAFGDYKSKFNRALGYVNDELTKRMMKKMPVLDTDNPSIDNVVKRLQKIRFASALSQDLTGQEIRVTARRRAIT